MPALIRRFPFASLFVPLRRRDAARAPQPEPSAAATAMPSTRELELEEIRGAAMRQMFPKLFSWRGFRMDGGMAIEVHNYLAGARTVTDLEQRIHAVERKRHFAS